MTVRCTGEFPPGKSGGLIEAGRGSRRRSLPCSWFPPGKSGGLIEAYRHQFRRPRDRHLFPPGKSGGLIEARRSTSPSRRCRSRFRRANPAASLKPELAPAEEPASLRFRRVNPAASLKQPCPPTTCPPFSLFPPGKSGGLIEARLRRQRPWIGHAAVSAG